MVCFVRPPGCFWAHKPRGNLEVQYRFGKRGPPGGKERCLELSEAKPRLVAALKQGELTQAGRFGAPPGKCLVVPSLISPRCPFSPLCWLPCPRLFGGVELYGVKRQVRRCRYKRDGLTASCAQRSSRFSPASATCLPPCGF